MVIDTIHYRWIIINIANETQFTLKYTNEWFGVGRFWDAPCSIAQFSQSFFSGCNTYRGAVGYHGVSGAALFHLQIPGQSGHHPITIAFSNPSIGTIKTRAEFCNDVKEVWKRMITHCTSHDEKHIIVGPQHSRIKLQLTSTSGTQAIVTVTQINDNETPVCQRDL